MGSQRNYEDFDLVIEQTPEGGYRARVAESPAGEASADFELPFSDLELENFLLKVGRPRRGTRRLESPEMAAARDFGGRLFGAVFKDDVRLCLRRSLDETERSGEGLRIRLRLNDAPGLVNIPWEYLFNESADRFLVLSTWTPIVRYPDMPQTIRPLAIEPPLRILALVSSPSDYPTLDVSEEAARIRSSLATLIEDGSVHLDTLEDATLIELQRKLRTNTYHVLHFIGHGGFDKSADDGVLVLEDGVGKSRVVSGRDLGTILADHRSLRLAVLNACDGARASSQDPFAGSAQSLIKQGLPAVVAMQFEITDGAAIAFAHEFYGALAEGSPVDAAVAEGRRAIFGLGNDIEWGTPVLYMRSPDGTLFDVTAPPERAVAGAEIESDRASAEELLPDSILPGDTAPDPTEATEPEPAGQEEGAADDPAADEGAPDDPVTQSEHAAGTRTRDTGPASDPGPDDSAPADPGRPATPAPRPIETKPSPPSTDPGPSIPAAAWVIGVVGVFLAILLGIAFFGGGDDVTTTTTANTTTAVTSTVTSTAAPTTTAAAIVAEPGVAVAVPFTTAPAIDGDDGDWGERVEHTTDDLVFRNSLIQNGTVARLGTNGSAVVLLGWDADNLYVFASVRDDVVSQPNTGNQIWRGDAITLNIAVGDQGSDASEDPDGNDFQLTLSPGDPAAGTAPGSVIFNGVNGRFGNDRTGVAQVAAQFPDGEFAYLLEARIPWEVFGVENPGDVPEFGALVALFDNDGELETDGVRSLQAVILGNTPDAVFQGPSTWGSLSLGP